MSITAAAAGRGTTGSLSLPWIIAASRLFCGHAYRRLGQREPYPRVGFIVTNLTRSAESRRRPIDTPDGLGFRDDLGDQSIFCLHQGAPLPSSPVASLTRFRLGRRSGEAFFHLVKLCFCQIFKRQELVAGTCTDSDQLV